MGVIIADKRHRIEWISVLHIYPQILRQISFTSNISLLVSSPTSSALDVLWYLFYGLAFVHVSSMSQRN